MASVLDQPSSHNGLAPPHRVVFLGASNLARGFPAAVDTACRLWGRPAEVLLALGHGRSFGLRKAMLWRELPGITACGLWPALERGPGTPTTALLTDVGNDLLYEVPVPEIVAWVGECLDRLRRAGARVVVTGLPLCSVQRLSPARFLFFRKLLFSSCRLTYTAVVERAFDLDRRLRGLAKERGALVAEPRPEWYGFDPIHIRRRLLPAAWREILSPLAEPVCSRTAPLSFRHGVRLRLCAPDQRWLFGRERRTAQPAYRLPDGTTVALY